MLSVFPVRTPIYEASVPLANFVATALSEHLRPGDIVAITSKIFSVAEHRTVSPDSIGKRELIEREADRFLGEGPYGVCLTIKHGIFIPSAGIDESNSAEGDYLLFPEDPFASSEALRRELVARLGVSPIGILMTDSHTTPLRWGVTGIGLGFAGFHPVHSLVGRNDLFGRPLQFTRVNRLDALAAAAVLEMGESDECTPLAIIRGATVEFSETINPADIRIPLEEDLYRDFFRKASKGGGE